MISKNLFKIINILNDANGAIYQKDLIWILRNDINERQVRRYLKKLEELAFLKISKLDNKCNILYITTKVYKEIVGIERRTSNTCNNYILEKNFMVSYMKYKYRNIFQNDIFKDVYDKSSVFIQDISKVKVLEEYKQNVIMHNMYIYKHQEMKIIEEYTTILQIIIYKHTVNGRDLKKLIIVLNELIERFVDVENNIIIDYKIYSFSDTNIKLLEKEIDKYYSKKTNTNDIADKCEIEFFNLRKRDYDI